MRRRQVAPAEGARLLVAWLRHTGNHGAWAAEHIDDFWAMFCRKYRIEHIEPSFIRSEIAAMAKPGTGLKFEGRKRLAKARYEFIRDDLGRDRATVYYIGPVKKSDGKSRVASPDRPVAVVARPAAGQGRAAPSQDRLAA